MEDIGARAGDFHGDACLGTKVDIQPLIGRQGEQGRDMIPADQRGMTAPALEGRDPNGSRSGGARLRAAFGLLPLRGWGDRGGNRKKTSPCARPLIPLLASQATLHGRPHIRGLFGPEDKVPCASLLGQGL